MMIKLNDKGIRAYMATGGSKYRPRLDWQSTGTVSKYSRDRAFAYVVWNGNQSCDRVSVILIESAGLSQGGRIFQT
jgi:hypothetical protein